jgi:hypothetical protein
LQGLHLFPNGRVQSFFFAFIYSKTEHQKNAHRSDENCIFYLFFSRDTYAFVAVQERSMIGMKRKAKQLLASCLSVAMALTSPLTSFADEKSFANSSANGNTEAGYVTGAGGDFSANISDGGAGLTSGKIGIRLSLVDPNDPSRVISVDNDGNPQVLDLLYVTEDTWEHQTREKYHSDLYGAFTFNSIKTQSLTSVETNPNQKIMPIYYDELNSELTDGDMPPWLYHNGSYVANGEAFVQWSQLNNYGQNMVTDDGQFMTVDVSGYAMPLVAYTFTTEDGEAMLGAIAAGGTNVNYSISEYASIGDATYVEMTDRIDALKDISNYQERYDTIINKEYKHSTTEQIKAKAYQAIAQELLDEVRDAKTALLLNQAVNGTESSAGVAEEIERAKDAALASLKDENGNSIATQVETYYNKLASFDAGGLIDDRDIPNDAVTFGLTGTSGGKETYAHLYQLLSMKDSTTGHYYLQTEKMRKNTSLVLNDEEVEDWVLLVEPIVWLSIFPVGDDSRLIHSKIYGTITNVVQAFNDPSVPANPESLYNYRNRQTFNYKALNQACWWALTVDDETGWAFVNSDNQATMGFYPAQSVGSFRSFTELYNSISSTREATVTAWKQDENGETYGEEVTIPCTEGWGVNVYSKNMFEKAPQPTTDIDGDDDDGSKPIKVVKWYVNEKRDENNNIVSQSNVMVKVGSIDKKLGKR